MPSDAKARRAAAKKAQSILKRQGKSGGSSNNGSGVEDTDSGTSTPTVLRSANCSSNDLAGMVSELNLQAKHRAVTGVLASRADARDLQLHMMSITFHGAELLVDAKCDLVNGRRYGLIGSNGCGKSSLLSVLGNREVPIPDHIDIYHLSREMPPSDKTALQSVMEVDEVRIRLEKEAEELASQADDEEAHERLMEVYERLDSLDSGQAEKRAAQMLWGLGFTKQMQRSAVKNFSGGWRMRIALARALFIRPALLLLDEPTNHLDLEACVWLEGELKEYKRILVIISHSQDFLNGVCTNIIDMTKKKLVYYGGNYDTYVQTLMEHQEHQMKRYKKEQSEIAHMKNYIARFGHGSAKLARQAQSKEKTMKRMVDGGLTEKVSSEKTLTFYFYECGTVPPPVLMVQNVSFRYDDDKPYIYRDLDFGFDLDTRIALVGPNGAGKSTLLKLLCGELVPTEGIVRRNSHLKIGRYHQHLTEKLDMNLSALEFMMKEFPEVKEVDNMRKIVGRYGLSGQQQVCPIRNLSDGQRCRVAFAWLAWQVPHILLLDEPTNHLDIETIDSLADAINGYDGGMILVSHDFRLISQVADEIWICEKQTVTKWEGDIFEYKKALAKRVKKELAKNMA